MKKILGMTEDVNYALQKEYDLNLKVDDFNKWCYENKIKGNYTSTGEFQNQNMYRDFIEKMAIWYELRYPDYEVSKLFGEEINLNVNEEMYNNNPYIQERFANTNRLLNIDWKEFFNFTAFKNSLTPKEQSFLTDPTYPSIININNSAHMHLTSDGYVEECDYLYRYTYKIDSENLIGLHIKDVLALFKENEIQLPVSTLKSIKLYEINHYFKENLLDCVMYRIIERGGNRVGPRRAFLFAKEFQRNIEIPMKYGINTSDPKLYSLIIEYLNAGGNFDLDCYDDYFSRESKHQKLEIINLQKVIELELNSLKNKNMEREFEILFSLIPNTVNKVLKLQKNNSN